MTQTSKDIIDTVLAGGYLASWKKQTGTKCFRLCDAKGNPIGNVRLSSKKAIEKFLDPKVKLWKKDKSGRITFNLSIVRKMHGRSYIKKQYKKLKTEK